jgi:predicted Zn-ribbon and HTH transcriptional regulator
MRLATPRVTRRRVVVTTAKLAYATPVVAATFRLTANGALAATCPEGYVFDPDTTTEPARCCRCTNCTIAIATYNPDTDRCEARSPSGRLLVCGTPICVPVTQSPPA